MSARARLTACSRGVRPVWGSSSFVGAPVTCEPCKYKNKEEGEENERSDSDCKRVTRRDDIRE